MLHVTDKELIYLLFRKPAPRYRTFTIRKRDGSVRTIHAPQGSLKIVQQKLNHVLQAVYRPMAPVHGFARERSIVSNAMRHVKRRWVFNLDIENFFPTIHFGRVMGMFGGRTYSLPRPAAMALAQICCYESALPQGAPTSPIVSNMVCGPIDIQLRHLAAAHHCHYTRYADDITFSADVPQIPATIAVVTADGVKVGDDLRRLLESNSFRINEAKVRLFAHSQRQKVTGLVTNEFPNVPRQFVRRVRGMLHAWERFGEEAAAAEFRARHDRKQRRPDAPQPPFRNVLRGRLEFIRMVKGTTDPVFFSLWNRLSALAPDDYVRILDVHTADDVPSALWVLDSEEGQGTGFILKGHGLVTCAHCVHSSTVAVRADDPDKRFGVRVLRLSKELDLAILAVEYESGAPMGGVLLPGDSTAVQPATGVELFGFPNYAPGNAADRHPTTVTGCVRKFNTRMFMLNTPVFPGSSGGPAINSKARVIGVIRSGYHNNEPAQGSLIDIAERRCCTARSKSLTSLCRLQSHPAQYVSGIPSAAILLSISHPIRCSTRCLANVRARISGPMIAL